MLAAVFSRRRRKVPHAIGAAAEGGAELERFPLLTEFECRRQQKKKSLSTTTTKRSSGCTRLVCARRISGVFARDCAVFDACISCIRGAVLSVRIHGQAGAHDQSVKVGVIFIAG